MGKSEKVEELSFNGWFLDSPYKILPDLGLVPYNEKFLITGFFITRSQLYPSTCAGCELSPEPQLKLLKQLPTSSGWSPALKPCTLEALFPKHLAKIANWRDCI